eukprot:gnl/MRDRNA2_/MRDRNA2_70025_c0_seq1.p1 gnl/MRDRNA2_/MRDRNA2_70025_c0~~gnl/MRDRNA2_/MRDRNA2_70025_c0_seq1.p1  ORF type:complete len:751 (-),score=147.49 gnl/MRDRNA2_/MRDRNA2_70025_c0_seq1:11-2263(-)
MLWLPDSEYQCMYHGKESFIDACTALASAEIQVERQGELISEEELQAAIMERTSQLIAQRLRDEKEMTSGTGQRPKTTLRSYIPPCDLDSVQKSDGYCSSNKGRAFPSARSASEMTKRHELIEDMDKCLATEQSAQAGRPQQRSPSIPPLNLYMIKQQPLNRQPEKAAAAPEEVKHSESIELLEKHTQTVELLSESPQKYVCAPSNMDLWKEVLDLSALAAAQLKGAKKRAQKESPARQHASAGKGCRSMSPSKRQRQKANQENCIRENQSPMYVLQMQKALVEQKNAISSLLRPRRLRSAEPCGAAGGRRIRCDPHQGDHLPQLAVFLQRASVTASPLPFQTALPSESRSSQALDTSEVKRPENSKHELLPDSPSSTATTTVERTKEPALDNSIADLCEQTLHPAEMQPEGHPTMQELQSQDSECPVENAENVLLEKSWVVADGQGPTTGNVEGYIDQAAMQPTKPGPDQESVSTRTPYSTPCNEVARSIASQGSGSSASISLTSQSSKHKIPPLNLDRRLSTCSSSSFATSLHSELGSSRWQDINLQDFPLPASHRLRSMQRDRQSSLQSSDSVASFLSACDSDRRLRALRSQETSRSCVDLPICVRSSWNQQARGLSSHWDFGSCVDLPVPEDNDEQQTRRSHQAFEHYMAVQTARSVHQSEDQGPLPFGQPTAQLPKSTAGRTPKVEDDESNGIGAMADSTIDLLQALYASQAERRQTTLNSADPEYQCKATFQPTEHSVVRRLHF